MLLSFDRDTSDEEDKHIVNTDVITHLSRLSQYPGLHATYREGRAVYKVISTRS
jgi:hypothetical protein